MITLGTNARHSFLGYEYHIVSPTLCVAGYSVLYLCTFESGSQLSGEQYVCQFALAVC